MAFLLELDKLKEVWRKNYVSGTPRAENSAEHSWHGAMAALALAPAMPAGVDSIRVALMMVVHDLGEIDTGDVLAYAKDDAKAAIEEMACVDRLSGILPSGWGDGFRELWMEFEEGASPEARVARSIDRLLPCLENLAARGRAWRENGVTREMALARLAAIGESFPALWDEIRPRVVAVFEA